MHQRWLQGTGLQAKSVTQNPYFSGKEMMHLEDQIAMQDNCLEPKAQGNTDLWGWGGGEENRIKKNTVRSGVVWKC